MIIRSHLNSLLSLVKSGLIYCAAAAAVQVAGAKKWDVSRPLMLPLGNNTSLGVDVSGSIRGISSAWAGRI